MSTSVKARPRQVGVVGDPVPGDAGSVLDDGLAAAQDAVDQSRLADVGTADHGEYRGRATGAVIFVFFVYFGARSTLPARSVDSALLIVLPVSIWPARRSRAMTSAPGLAR